MNKIVKVIIATGGTGGHVFPAYSLAKHFTDKNFDVELISDKRGKKYLKNHKEFKVNQINSTPIIKDNFFSFFKSILIIFLSGISIHPEGEIS